jgi:hypothetical protein
MQEIYPLFNITISEYWKTHYVFDKQHTKKDKKLSKSFVDLVVLNCILPFKFSYGHAVGSINPEELMALASEITAEKNSIIDKFNQFGLFSSTSYDSQAILQLKKEYCNTNKCLNCAIGQKLINFTT